MTPTVELTLWAGPDRTALFEGAAQALSDDLVLVTADDMVAQYPVRTLRA